MAAPTVRTLTTQLAGTPGVVVRPFADQAGALIVGPRAAYIVEVEQGSLSEPTAERMYRLDHALGQRPLTTTMVRTEADIERLAAAVIVPRPAE